ncbi:MAG: prepilin-type N-terminal cleavage/methylation domain-containing protein [Phycisphaera sp.]|nr:prepilin-type N-terminal cleavage/methylation domain-containing protein [Phycisphaera sp.]
MSQKRYPHSHPAARGFTLMELMVVIVILVLLIGILLPALHSARAKSLKTTNLAQLSSIAKACESYQLAYQGVMPGYLKETDIADNSGVREVFTGNENLVLSLMGGMVSSTATIGTAFSNQAALNSYMGNDSSGSAQKIDIDKVGLGPQSAAGRQFGSFYSPKENELFAVTGTLTSDNNMPELVDGAGGSPILYYRATPPVGTGVSNAVGFCRSCSDAPSLVGSSAYFTFLRGTCVDYLDAVELNTAKGKYVDNKDTSLFSATHANSVNGGPGGRGTQAVADNQLAWWTIHESMSDVASAGQGNANQDSTGSDADIVKGQFVLIAAGPDGVFCDDTQNGGNLIKQASDRKNFDDVSVVGGIK